MNTFVKMDLKRPEKNTMSVYFVGSCTTLEGPEVIKYEPGSGQLFMPKTEKKPYMPARDAKI